MSSTRRAPAAFATAALAAAALTGAAPSPESMDDRAAAAMVRIFPGDPLVAVRTLVLTDAERRAVAAAGGDTPAGDTVHVHVASLDGAVLGYALTGDVAGKDRPITVMVATDTAWRVRAVEILAYREAYGGEVRQESWRRQFVGKTPDDPVRWGREIRNISGATISARSVTRGVKTALATLDALKARLAR